jgi:hypothetical protein
MANIDDKYVFEPTAFDYDLVALRQIITYDRK